MATPTAPQSFFAADVQAHLSRILAWPAFATSRQMTNFLRYVVEEFLSGRGDRLKERAVALSALGRRSGFDPRLDSIVRVVAGKVRRALEHYYAVMGATDGMRVELPRGTYCPSLRRLDAELSMHTTASVLRDAAVPRHCTGARPVVAVVPFVSFTGGIQERLLANLLTDDLTVQLSRFRWLEVIDCLAMRLPDAQSVELTSVASRLRADCVLGGTAGRVGCRVRLTVRLVDAASGVLLWADQYEPEFGDDRVLQEHEIVDRIVTGVAGLFAGTHFTRRVTHRVSGRLSVDGRTTPASSNGS